MMNRADNPDMINKRASKGYGLLGEKLSHSYSKLIHEKLGRYPYELFPMPPEQLPAFLAERNFAGLNVTIPYKTVVAAACDVVDPKAAVIGAINTLYFKDGKLHGANTDYDGLAYAADHAGISFSGKKVLLLGGGGTSRTARALILDAGAKELVIAERNPSKPDGVPAGGVSSGSMPTDGIKIVDYNHLPKDAEIIVNTTPVGTFPNNLESLIRLEDFVKCTGVLDVVYNPLSTMLVLKAKELGIPASGGLPMLVAQALRSAELFTGNPGLLSETDRILDQLMSELGNVVLIGMPGSGKSSFGKKLAKKLNKKFVDLDGEIAKQAGKSIPDIFARDGETAFRAMESRAAMDFGKQKGLVIATGGGVLLDPRNIPALKQNGKMIFIDRPLDSLATTGRPLSTGQAALQEMERIRRPLYEKYQDATVVNQGPFIQVLSELVEASK